MKGRAKICVAGTEVVGEVVTLSNSDNTDVVAWRWSLMGTPPGSDVTLGGRTMSRTTFKPDRPGKYVIRLEVNEGRVPPAPFGSLSQMHELVYEARPILQPHDEPWGSAIVKGGAVVTVLSPGETRRKLRIARKQPKVLEHEVARDEAVLWRYRSEGVAGVLAVEVMRDGTARYVTTSPPAGAQP